MVESEEMVLRASKKKRKETPIDGTIISFCGMSLFWCKSKAIHMSGKIKYTPFLTLF